jgi:hypothetical protein
LSEDLVDKAKDMLAKLKRGNAFNMNLRAIRLMEKLVKEVEKLRSKLKP